MMMTKKILLILITFHVSLFTATAQKLLVEKPTLECGRTGFQQPVTAIFDLKNKSRKKLVIESVKPDCGCTAVEYPKEVGAGDKFTIKMTYDARQLGHFQKSAAVISNASKQPVYLTMRGVVLTEVQDYTGSYPLSMGALLFDQDVLEFDDVNKGDAPIQEIHLLNNGLSVGIEFLLKYVTTPLYQNIIYYGVLAVIIICAVISAVILVKTYGSSLKIKTNKLNTLTAGSKVRAYIITIPMLLAIAAMFYITSKYVSF